MSKTPILIAILAVCIFSSNLSAQKSPIKYGKVLQEDLESTHYALDSSASAVILGDVGSSEFQMDKTTHEWRIIFKRHTRIKIFTKDGYDFANVEIPYYDPGHGDEETISALKATSYNIDDGKVVKSKMSKSELFDEKSNKYWHKKSFAIPNVKEGTIIEYSYIVTSDFIRNLREWEFQNTIPVVYSQYKVTIPEFFNYQFLSQGYEEISNDTDRKQEEFEYQWRTKPGSGEFAETRTSTLKSILTKLFFI